MCFIIRQLLSCGLLLCCLTAVGAGPAGPPEDATVAVVVNPDFEFPAPTRPLLPQFFFREHPGVCLAAGGAGLAGGITLMILGIINFADQAETGFGSPAMNRGLLLLDLGILTATVSGLFVEAALQQYLRTPGAGS